jgi:hypothetical protein
MLDADADPGRRTWVPCLTAIMLAAQAVAPGYLSWLRRLSSRALY